MVLRPPNRNNRIGSKRVRWSVRYEGRERGWNRTLDEVVIVIVKCGEPLSLDELHQRRLELREKNTDKEILNWIRPDIPGKYTGSDLSWGEAVGALRCVDDKWTIVPEVLEMQPQDFAYIQETFSL